MVYDVTNIFEQINGHAGICYPATDAEGRKILSQETANDPLLFDIKHLIEQCVLIEHKPLKFEHI